jgi:nicotinate-nucleotide adenylyltransferase
VSLTPVATRRRTRLVPVGRPAPSGRPRPARDAPPPNRIGILGGTFDPPHIGHLWLATMAADEMHLSRVLLVPAANPPHKRRRAISHAADRVLMARLAVANDPRLDVSLVELEREGPSYTVDTLGSLRGSCPGDELVLIVGSDTFPEMGGWRDSERVFSLSQVAVVTRPGVAPPAAPARATRVSGPALAVSSSAIRDLLRQRKSVRYLVPAPVADYIETRGLYR